MKMAIRWHEECLANSLRVEKEKREQLEMELKACNEIIEWNTGYAHQISEAKKVNKDSFDRDKFRKKQIQAGVSKQALAIISACKGEEI